MGKVTLQKATGSGFRESLGKSNLSMTLQVPTCASHVACFAGQQSQKPLLHRFFTKLSHTTLT